MLKVSDKIISCDSDALATLGNKAMIGNMCMKILNSIQSYLTQIVERQFLKK